MDLIKMALLFLRRKEKEKNLKTNITKRNLVLDHWKKKKIWKNVIVVIKIRILKVQMKKTCVNITNIIKSIQKNHEIIVKVQVKAQVNQVKITINKKEKIKIYKVVQKNNTMECKIQVPHNMLVNMKKKIHSQT